jgi:hypothetical protein
MSPSIWNLRRLGVRFVVGIRRTIKPAFGSTQVRKLRGPQTEHTGTWVLSAHHIVRALRMGLAKA